jgi:hypothetical protein
MKAGMQAARSRQRQRAPGRAGWSVREVTSVPRRSLPDLPRLLTIRSRTAMSTGRAWKAQRTWVTILHVPWTTGGGKHLLSPRELSTKDCDDTY